MAVTQVLAFDVNETLLDLRALDAAFEDLFGTPTARPLWFARCSNCRSSAASPAQYVDFTTRNRRPADARPARRTCRYDRQIDATVGGCVTATTSDVPRPWRLPRRRYGRSR